MNFDQYVREISYFSFIPVTTQKYGCLDKAHYRDNLIRLKLK